MRHSLLELSCRENISTGRASDRLGGGLLSRYGYELLAGFDSQALRQNLLEGCSMGRPGPETRHGQKPTEFDSLAFRHIRRRAAKVANQPGKLGRPKGRARSIRAVSASL